MAFTFFFRDIHTLELAIRRISPEVSGRSKIRVWDAGCAMGPETYTIAILLAENFGRFSFKNIHIDATDIDEQDTFGDIIQKAIYPYDLLQRIPEQFFKAYFTPYQQEGYYQVADSLKEKVHFHKHNLLSLNPVGDGYTLIVCKNVLLHFTQQQRIEVLKMYHRSLMPGGYLILERTQQLPTEVRYLFEPLSSEAQFFKAVEIQNNSSHIGG
jgi:chemotaxis protein methyltransferase CheR